MTKPIAPDTLMEHLRYMSDSAWERCDSVVGEAFDNAIATLEANNRQLQLCREAARALIADVRSRYPGEELRCPLMIALEASIEGVGE